MDIKELQKIIPEAQTVKDNETGDIKQFNTMEAKGKYKAWEYSIKSYGVELYLPHSTKIFNTVGQMKDYIDIRLIEKFKI